MISCKRATELVSKRMEEPLSLKDALELKLHLFICEFCERFRQQIELLNRALGTKSEDSNFPDPTCSTTSRDMISNDSGTSLDACQDIPVPEGAKQRLKDRLQGRD